MRNYNNLKNVRIGITGSTGVVGNRLIEMLLSRNANVTCLVRESSKIDYDRSKVNLIYGHLNDTASIEKFIGSIDVCIHLAAQVSLTKRERYHLINVEGTENLCKAIVRVNPDCKLICCSSIAAYRMTSFYTLQYTDYAKSKRKADLVVEDYQKKYGLKCATVIPGMIYGPGKNKFIPTIISWLNSGDVYFVSGGEKSAPLTYVDDLCELFILAALEDKAIGNRYFAFDTEIGIQDLIWMIARKTSVEIAPKKFRKGLLMNVAICNEFIYNLFDIARTPKYTKRMVDVLSINYDLKESDRVNNLGWTPRVDAETGIDNSLRWYYKNLEEDPIRN